jgi:predicted DCC family thiol-disulfide oxidoreductase YuxK
MPENSQTIPETLYPTDSGLVIYDGLCVLCSSAVRFLLRIDKKKVLHFTSIKKTFASDHLNPEKRKSTQPESILYIENQKLYSGSEAIIMILIRIGSIWKSARLLRVIPLGFREFLYRIIAKNRYTIFGKKTTCDIPDEKHAARFLPEIDPDELVLLTKSTALN